MVYKVSLSTRAERDIADAYAFLRTRSPTVAARWFSGLATELISLREMPARFPAIPEVNTKGFELRHALYGRRRGTYRIVFRILQDRGEVHVLTVRHGAREPFSEDEIEQFD